MKRYRYVGDIHGQFDKMQAALEGNVDRVIFCGDFLDSWRRTPEEQFRCLELALELADKGFADFVYANHEMSYFQEGQRCSGWNPITANLVLPFKNDYFKKGKPYIYEQGVLVTHAGLTKLLWERQELTLDLFQQVLAEWAVDTNSPYYYVGYDRGGNAPYGGPIWCDIRGFEPIDGLPQVFGHSRGKDFRRIGNSICIDVLENNIEPIFYDVEYDV